MPYLQAYKQIRKETQHKLEEIITPKNYLDWWNELCMLLKVFLKDSGWICFKSDSWTSKSVFPITLNYFNFHHEVIWDKGCIGLGRYIRVQHENIECFFSNNGGKHYWKYPSLKKVTAKFHGNSDGTPAFSSILRVNKFNNGTLGKVDKDDHINQTPLEVWTNFIEYMCPPNGIVLDPCCGTGSVGIEALRLKRRYYGIEIDPKYLALAKKSLQCISTQKIKRLRNYGK